MLTPPIEPMLAKPMGHAVPAEAADLVFEPKWDGFRCLVFVTAETVVLQGRGRSNSAPGGVVDLAYAFPELVAAVREQVPVDTVVDGEIVVENAGRLDFAALSSRLRPRTEAGGGNIARLSVELPASILAFDLLWASGDVMHEPFQDRRRRLEQLAQTWEPPLLLTPTTRDPDVARDWFERFESAGVDGLIVKPPADPYSPGKRTQGKIKHQRTIDAVVAGWRPHARPGVDGQPVIGSLLLGLFDEVGVLHYVGASSAFTAGVRASLVGELAPITSAALEPHPWRGETTANIPGEANRWKKEQAWIALRPERVVEVTYDQLEGRRLRHTAGFVRWRPDRSSDSCTFEQLEIPPPSRIDALLA